MEEYLNINSFIPQSNVNGPGSRFTIWFQGCPFNCRNCFNKGLQTIEKKNEYTLSKLYNLIIKTKNIDGVTFTGGEPFLQARSLSKLSKKLRDFGISVISYTGYLIEDLINSDDKYKRKLLSELDILIDGIYDENLKIDKSWIGSSNQRIHYLSNKYKKNNLTLGEYSEVEFHINSNGEILLTGFPDNNFSNILYKDL